MMYTTHCLYIWQITSPGRKTPAVQVSSSAHASIHALQVRSIRNTIFIAVATAIIIATSLLVKVPGKSVVGNEFQNAAHILAFSLITFIALIKVNPRTMRTPLLGGLLISVCIIVLGLVIECAQWFIARGFSPLDLVRNLVGVCVGGALYVAWISSVRRRMVALSVAVLLLMGSLLPTVMLIVSGTFKPDLPTLADFEQWGVTHRIRSPNAVIRIDQNDALWPANTTLSANVQFQAERRWPSMMFLEVNSQWFNYSQMRFRVFNPQAEPLRLYIRVDDLDLGPEPDNRMTVSRMINPGESVISIPLDDFKKEALKKDYKGQALMKRISKFVLFLRRLDKNTTLVFDEIELTN